THDVQTRIMERFATLGLPITAEAHFGLRDNFSFGNVPRERVERAINVVATAEPDAIIILCTNLDGASVAAQAERRLGIPILDSVVVSLWGALRACGYPVTALSDWSGALARLPAQQTERTIR
ncbi:MAG: Asp/Glu/hydantoin racemase, partial [Oricola sp.]